MKSMIQIFSVHYSEQLRLIEQIKQKCMHFLIHYIMNITNFIKVAFYNAVCTKIFQVKICNN